MNVWPLLAKDEVLNINLFQVLCWVDTTAYGHLRRERGRDEERERRKEERRGRDGGTEGEREGRRENRTKGDRGKDLMVVR